MSQEGGSERTQRTVAELLAKYGGNSGESAPRRRRRKPDDASDTAPQAIIERVMSDSGKLLPIREDQEPHERVSHRQGRPQPPAPKQPPAPHQPPPAPPVERQQPPPAERRAPQQPSQQLPPPQQPAAPLAQQQPLQHQPPTVQQPPVPPPSPPQASQQLPVRRRADPQSSRSPEPPTRVSEPPTRVSEPVRRPQANARPDNPEPLTEQLPRVPDEVAPEQAEPPAGLAGGPNRAPLLPRRGPGARRGGPQPGQPQPGQQPGQPQPGQQPGQPQAGQQPGQPQPTGALPAPAAQPPKPTFPPAPGRGPREFPGDSSETMVEPQGAPPEFLEEFEGFDEKAATRFDDYRAHDEFPADRAGADLDRRPPRRAPGDLDDLDDFDDLDDPEDLDRLDVEPDERDRLDDLVDEDDLDDLDERGEGASAGREWLIMAGQLALGVVGGAVVWLGFNWLWRVLPAAALIGALAVIVGLVLIVRKIRRAEDLQTTVLAVLVGLVATVSPAALLLLGR